MTRKICVITGSRAEYGLLRWVMQGIKDEPTLTLQVIATGMHLSPQFGNTYQEIEDDGFAIDRRVEMLTGSDTPVGIAKSMGNGLIGFADALNELNPDLIVVLGDRFEIFSAVSAALVARIPVAHIHGGELTEGNFDDALRHSITKMSHLHFVAAEAYQNRVIQLGESPDRVFNVGGLGVDNVTRTKLSSKDELAFELQFKFQERNLLVTFHPVTLEPDSGIEQLTELLDALDSFPEIGLIFTMSNADNGGQLMNRMVQAYTSSRDNASSYRSLGTVKYLSTLACVEGVIGNSSSGLLEAPSYRVGTVNIGDRQKGRLQAQSVISCDPDKHKIETAIRKLLSDDFRSVVQNVRSPFGSSGASAKIVEIIKKATLADLGVKTFLISKTRPGMMPMFINKADWMRAIIDKEATIEEAIINLEMTALRVSLVVDKNEQLIGIITDGDIRRGFIKGLDLGSPVSQILNSEPVTVDGEAVAKKIVSLMEEFKIDHIPIVNEFMKLIGLFVSESRSKSNSYMNRVVIMAGGKGIRMRPLTENTPKPMLLVAGTPILEHIIERFKKQGFSRFTICIGYLGELIKEYFEDGSKWDVEIEYLSEESPLGTAGPMRNLQNIGDLPFIVTNGDIISEIDMADLVEFHVEQRAVATMAIRSYELQSQFGVVETNGIEISAIIEKPIYRTQISTGVYVFDPNVLKQLPNSDVLQMPDLFDYLRNLGYRTLAFHFQDQWIDLANQEDIHETQKIISNSKNRQS